MSINAVIDLSHHIPKPDFAAAARAGIIAVIHKATQGRTMVDRTYDDRRRKALDAGLLWGAYHFGTYAGGVEQADHFLNTVEPDEQTLLVLDYEPNGTATMTLAQAKSFARRVNSVTGRSPGLYSGVLIKEQLGDKPADQVLAECFLWLAQYGRAPTRIPPTWPTWTLWQYTDGVAGPLPHRVPGIGPCSRSRFNGDLKGLRKLWGVGNDTQAV